jgi:serine phosphatase RsbU (regulator of sigma subunit)
VSTPGEALRVVLREADKASVDALPSVLVTALSGAGVRGVVLYLVDYDQRLLLPAPGSVSVIAPPEAQSVSTSQAGRACTHQTLIESVKEGLHKVWVPVSERADCLGVLELELTSIDDDMRHMCTEVGVLLGHLLVTAHQYTDVYELQSRRRDMNLPAEMHWEIQPAMSYAGPRLRIAGGIEPAYEVGGDAFDYNINRGILDFALLDAMGHGLEAALLSFQAIAAFRYGRRRMQSLAEVAHTLEDALLRQFGGERFVTGLMCKLDSHSGVLRWVNAAHLPPLHMHAGRVLRELKTVPNCPLGLGLATEFMVHEITLEPGDSIVLYSDGIIEARSPNGEDFELERLLPLIEGGVAQRATPTSIVRSVIRDVREHSVGPLRDDATLVLLEYIGDS